MNNIYLNRISLFKMYAVVLIILVPIVLFAQDNFDKQTEVHLSDPGEPGILIVNHIKGSINVTAYEGKIIIIQASFRKRSAESQSDQSVKGIQIDVLEKDNEVTVTTNLPGSTIDLKILTPRNFSLKLETYHNGKILVRNISGEMEISNINGEIILDEVSGSAILNTIDGNITAVFNEISLDVPMAFTTIYGNIDISFPGNTSALIKMKSEHGETTNDFPMAFEKRRSPKRTSANSVYIEEWIYGKINDGGAEILIKSFDGNIYLRKR